MWSWLRRRLRRETSREVHVRAPSFGALLDLCAAVPLSEEEGAEVYGPVRLSGDARPTPDMVTEANAGAVLDALHVTESRFTDRGAMVETARACLAAFLAACHEAEAAARSSVEAVEDACVAYLGGGSSRSGLERALGQMDARDFLALWDAPLGVALRYVGWGNVQAVLREQMTARAN